MICYLQDRVILAPTNDIVDSVNENTMSLNQDESKVFSKLKNYFQILHISDMFNDVHSMEFLIDLKCSRLSNQKMNLKV